jgi:hypothetical protein
VNRGRIWQWPRIAWTGTAELGLVASLTLVALVLRVAGVSYGLPRIFHDDTPKQLYRVKNFMLGDLVPRDAYPTPHMYVVAALLKGVEWLDSQALRDGVSIGHVAVTARLLNAALGGAIVPLLYLAGRRLLGAPVGVLAAALVAVSPLLVLHAHYEMGDVPQTFFVTLALVAAARALLQGGAAALVLGGAAAGLAASAKFYGALAFAPLVVAAVAGPYGPWRRRIALLAGAGATAAAAFVLSTPKLLLTPGRYLTAFQEVFETAPPPPLLARPFVAARGLTGHALEWFDPLLLAAGVVGVGLLLRRREPRTLLPLVVPALVLALYGLARAHRLDDRNLVILTPFLCLAAATTVVWLASRHRRLRHVAAVLGIVMVGWSALNGAHVAYLFWQDDTRMFAARWLATAGEPAPQPLLLTYHDSVEAYRATGAGLLMLESKEWRVGTVWHTVTPSDQIRRAVAFLEARGKLLKRFELWPLAFTSPTLDFYDLDSFEVPHAFPPPDTVALAADRLTFLDEAAVPEAPGLFLVHRHPAATTLVSRAPLARLTLGLSGQGVLHVHQGGQRSRVELQPGRLTLVTVPLRRSFPWFKYFYPLRLETRGGHFYARLLTTPCQLGRAHLAYGQWAEALPHLEACRGRWEEPARLLDLAWTRAELGDSAAARQAVQRLNAVAPGLLQALDDLARQEDGDSWRERYRRLAGHDRWFWDRHAATLQAEARTIERVGVVVERPGAGGDHVVQAGGGAAPGYLKHWFQQNFLRGHHLVRFRLRGRGAGAGGTPLATLSVVRHFQGRVHDVPVMRPWRPTEGNGRERFEEVVLPVSTDLEPVKFEARVEYHGRGLVEIDEISILPDVRARLTVKLDALRRAGAVP